MPIPEVSGDEGLRLDRAEGVEHPRRILKNTIGERVIDFHKSNLHVVSYSIPVHARMGLAKLRRHLFTRPAQPHVIRYRTAYYSPQWGFCLSHRQLTALVDEMYEVFIDPTLEDGSLTFGECYLPGTTNEEVLISCPGPSRSPSPSRYS
jgi:aminopeptidase-like protein